METYQNLKSICINTEEHSQPKKPPKPKPNQINKVLVFPYNDNPPFPSSPPFTYR